MINIAHSNGTRRTGAAFLAAAITCTGLLVPTTTAAAADAPIVGVVDASPTWNTQVTADDIWTAVTGLPSAEYADRAVTFPDGLPAWLTPVPQWRFDLDGTMNWSTHPPAGVEILETRDAPGLWEVQPGLGHQYWPDHGARLHIAVDISATRIADGEHLDIVGLTGSDTAAVEFDALSRLQTTIVDGVSKGPASSTVPVAAGGITWPWTAPVRHNLLPESQVMPSSWSETSGDNTGLGLTRSSCSGPAHVLVSPMAIETGGGLGFEAYPDLAEGRWFSSYSGPEHTATAPTRTSTAWIDASVIPSADGDVVFDLNDGCAGFGSPIVDTTLHMASPLVGSMTDGGQVVPLPVEHVNVADPRDYKTVTSAMITPDGSRIRLTGLTEAPGGFETYASAIGRALLADGSQINYALTLRVSPRWSDLAVDDKRYEVKAGDVLTVTEAELLEGGMPEVAQALLALAGYEQPATEPQVTVTTDKDGRRSFTLDATNLLPGYEESVRFTATPVTAFPSPEPQLASATATFVVVGAGVAAPPFRAETGGVGAEPAAVAGGVALLIAAAAGAWFFRRRRTQAWTAR